MPKQEIIYHCNICNGGYATEAIAAQCERKGKPDYAGSPLGLIMVGYHQETVAWMGLDHSDDFSPHLCVPVYWMAGEDRNYCFNDTIGTSVSKRNQCGADFFKHIREYHHGAARFGKYPKGDVKQPRPLSLTNPVKRLIAYLAAVNIEATIWHNNRITTLAELGYVQDPTDMAVVNVKEHLQKCYGFRLPAASWRVLRAQGKPIPERNWDYCVKPDPLQEFINLARGWSLWSVYPSNNSDGKILSVSVNRRQAPPDLIAFIAVENDQYRASYKGRPHFFKLTETRRMIREMLNTLVDAQLPPWNEAEERRMDATFIPTI